MASTKNKQTKFHTLDGRPALPAKEPVARHRVLQLPPGAPTFPVIPSAWLTQPTRPE
jgi:hypothetical protein